MRHLTAQTAHFEALPDDGWLTIVLDEPITLISLADIKLTERFRCLANYELLLSWSAFRKTDQKMVELLSDAPQEHNDVRSPRTPPATPNAFAAQ